MNNKADFMKIQTCVLKVSIHCDGCKQKVKKLLQKIEGVYTTSIDSEQGKVTVTGNVDPSVLIRKLEKSGKPAELWGGVPKGNNSNYQNQLKNMQLENSKGGKDNKPQNQKGMVMMQQMKGPKQVVPQKEQKAVKLSDEEFDDDDDDYDDDGYDSEFDEEDEEEEFGKMAPNSNKMFPNNMMPKGPHGPMLGPPMVMKGSNIGGKQGGGGGGKSINDKKGGEGGNNKMKNGGGAHDIDAMAKHTKGGGANNMDHMGKLPMPLPQMGKHPMDQMMGQIPKQQMGQMGKHPMGQMGQMENMIAMGQMPKQQMGQMPKQQMGPMGQRDGMQAVQGLPAGVYYQQGMPYSPQQQQQQQYMAMMMNQQRANGNEMFQPMMYARPPATVSYGPPMPAPVPVDPYTHYFSDENANSCTLM